VLAQEEAPRARQRGDAHDGLLGAVFGGAMARHKLTKAQKIRGLEKALKNRKTPKQFIPSMKKRLAKLRRG
jgi:hypothetical protein